MISRGFVPEALRVWELTKISLGAWVAAGTAGYFLYLRPRWYPKVEYQKAKEFTPREVEEWNQMQSSAKRESQP